MSEKEMPESGKIFALTLALMSILILKIVIGVAWLVQLIILQVNQFSDLARGLSS